MHHPPRSRKGVVMQVKIMGREPAAVIAVLGSIVTVLAALNLDFLNAGQAAAVTAFLSSVVIVATTRPVAPGVVTAIVSTGAALFAEYGLHASDALVGAITGAVLAVFALIGRGQVAPKSTAVTRA